MTTILIKFRDIPSYLHTGKFFRALDDSDPEGIIEIPADCFHHDGISIADLEEFCQLLKVMEFWMLDDIPLGVLNFCDENHVGVWERGIVDFLGQDLQPLLLTSYGDPDTVPLYEIIETGRWDLILHAVSRSEKNTRVAKVAARWGNLRLLKYLHEHDFEWDERVCAAASTGGYIDCLQYAHTNGCPWDSMTVKAAAKHGQFICLAYAHENGLPWDTDVCKYAALGGHLQCLEYAHENGCPWDSESTECAAQEGHIGCLAYALENSCPVDESACNEACRNGHRECLQLLHQFGVSWDKYTPLFAAERPDIACLQYLHEHGCPWDESTTTEAAEKGHSEPLRYALEHGCPHEGYVILWAAQSNSFECLRYLVEDQLLYMDEDVFIAVLLGGCLTNLQFLLDQSCPHMNADFADYAERWTLYDNQFRENNPQFVLCVAFAVERGWLLDEPFVRYIVTKDEPCRQWLIAEGYYIDE